MNSNHPRRVQLSVMRVLALAVLLAGVIVSASCGCTAGIFVPICDQPRRVITRPPWNPGPAPVRQLVHDYVYAELHHETAVRREVAGLLRQPVIRATGRLPRLPGYVGTARTAAGVVVYERLGNDTYARDDTADVLGNSLFLDAGYNETAWAVYQVAGFEADGVLTELNVHTSYGTFNGAHPGYWVGLANYNRGAWETKALTMEPVYTRAFSTTTAFLNGGSVYVFVLVADGQSVQIDRVSVEMDYPEWQEVILDASGDVGWTPAVAFTLTDNPIVVYSNYSTGKPQWAIGKRSDGLLDTKSWIIDDIDYMPDGFGTWLDVVVDPISGMPRVSMCYVNISSGVDNSRIGMSVLFEVDGNLGWYNYRLGDWVDGAMYTSIDVNPVSGAYGIASNAANSHNAEPKNDMHYRVFQINDPADYEDDDDVSFTRNFGDNFLFPHLRYHPTGGNGTVCVNGGYMYYEDAPGSWKNLYDIVDSSAHGSIAYNPVTNLLGQSFAWLEAEDQEDLTFVDYKDGFLAFPETVASLPTPFGTEHIGRSSQIAFAPDGTPGIAYTEQENGEIYIRYAYLDGDAWAVEAVSYDPSTPSSPNPLLLVDLAYDSEGTAALCYNHITGTSSTMRVAFRGL